VTVSYEEDGQELTISIEDTGTGISSEDLERLFDAYFRGSNSFNIAGEGLGLFVVKENLNKIGGTVSVESKPGEGSKFSIHLPLQAPDFELGQ